MRPIPLTRRHHLQHFTSTLEANGYSSERILDRLHMPMWQYGDANDLIPLRHVLSVLSKAARVVGDERFGLIVGEHNFINTPSTFGGLVSGSPTIYHAMKTSCRLANAHSSLARVWLREAGDTIWFCRSQFAGMDVGLRQHEQYIMMAFISIVRLGAGSTWKPAEMWLCTPNEASLEKTETLSDIRIRYGQPYGAIAVPRSVVCRPLIQRFKPNPHRNDPAKQKFLSTVPGDDFVGSLRQVIPALLADGCFQIECAADITGLHVRALQRELAREGVTFKQLIDEARFEAATGLLKEPNPMVTDIAFDLGYTDVAHFSRAFSRWAGVSPREYRRLNAA